MEAEKSNNLERKPWRPWELHKINTYIGQKVPLKRKEPGNCTRDNVMHYNERKNNSQNRESCKICNQVFTRKDNLTRHIKLEHNRDMKPFCKFCRRCFSRKDAVQRHEAYCTKNPINEIKSFTIEQNAPEYLTHKERLLNKYTKNSCLTDSNTAVTFRNKCLEALEEAIKILKPNEKITITITK